MTISRHEYRAVADGLHELAIVGGSLTMDESWTPYAQGTLTITDPGPAARAALDPRAGGRVTVYASQRFGTPALVEDTVTPVFAGQTAAAVTAAWAGLTAGDVTALWSSPYNPGGSLDSTALAADLHVRDWRASATSGELELVLASDEALLQDTAWTLTNDGQPVTDTIGGVVNYALDRLLGTAAVIEGPDRPLSPAMTAWSLGVSGWDYAAGPVEAYDRRLWCDERRTWRIDFGLTPSGRVLDLTAGGYVDLDDVLSRDGGDEVLGWFDAVIITYDFTDWRGVRTVRHDVAGPWARQPSKVLHLDRARPWPGEGAAQAILTRARRRGDKHQVRLVSDYTVRPGDVAALPAGSALITAVQWSLTDDEMTLTTRELET